MRPTALSLAATPASTRRHKDLAGKKLGVKRNTVHDRYVSAKNMVQP